MAKVANKTKASEEVEAKETPGLSWIPAAPTGAASKKKNDLNVSTIL